MALFKLTDEVARQATKIGELAMGLHVVEVVEERRSQIGYVLGDLVLMIPDDETEAQISDLLREPWMQPNPRWHTPDEKLFAAESTRRWDRGDSFERWRRSLEKAPKIERYLTRAQVLGMQYPGPPVPSAQIYGHLPYQTTTGANDVFYRCEPWPVSKRIDQSKMT